ncbi:methylase [Nitzschia inconspicua]|uniref:Methylase n=1 Tax=Nitzschia inconspicua TaxID=303405 RepID=A0A9K3LZA6_9STRA|nr:methylase [Nitzschia inconspicua]
MIPKLRLFLGTATTMLLVFIFCTFGDCLSFQRTVQRRRPIGRITSLDRSKIDTSNDGDFYSIPKMVTHTDDAFIETLQGVYRDYLPSTNEDGLVVFDIMSSHVSHLPPERTFRRVDVHGMNAEELVLNPARQSTNGSVFVRNLNDNPSFVGLIDDDQSYDAVLCCVGVQYLEDAEAVFAEALQGWINRGMKERARLVQDYLRAAGGFEDIQVLGDGVSIWKQLGSLGGFTTDPFVAVVARRNDD